MTWVKLDEKMPEHTKMLSLSDRAFRVHINALCFCNRNLTDGRLPVAALRGLGGAPRHAAELIAAGCWEKNGASGWMVHDYLDYQPSKEQVESDRKKKAAAGVKGAAKRWHNA